MITGAEGGCDCGKVRYRFRAEPIVVNCCHCLACQRQNGSAFAINVIVEADNIELLGEEPVATNHASGSGMGHRNYRCPHCGTSVWGVYGAAGDGARFVRAGTLDEPGAITPDVHIFTEFKAPWVTIPAGAEQFPGFYSGRDIPRVFGEANALRWRKALGR